MFAHKIFFQIGCPRTGSTFLYNLLNNVKEINLLPKENHFFLKKPFFKKKSFYLNKKINNISNYVKFLDLKKINYDINTLYFYDLESLKSIKKYFPNSQFFCVLRDPVKRHLSMSLTQIKKYHFYKSTNDFNFLISDFNNFKKSFLFKEQMLTLSNYKYHRKILIKNKINCKYYNYEDLFFKKKKLKKFFKDIKIKNYDLKKNYYRHSSLEYPIKFYNKSFFEKIKNFLLKNIHKKEINNILMSFKKNYPFKIMQKVFLSDNKSLRKIFLKELKKN